MGASDSATPCPFTNFFKGEGKEVFGQEVLRNRLNKVDRALFASASRACRASVAECGMPREKFFSLDLLRKLSLKHFVGSVELLRWARENGGPWGDFETCTMIASFGTIEVMQYAVREGLECTYDAFLSAALDGRLDMLQWMTPEMKTVQRFEHTAAALATHQAVVFGHLDCLRWLVENDFQMRPEILFIAAIRGNLACMQFAFEVGVPMRPGVLFISAFRGNLACMQFAFEVGVRDAVQLRMARDIAEEQQRPHVCQWIDSVMHLADPISFL
jgi:hypothetical protein